MQFCKWRPWHRVAGLTLVFAGAAATGVGQETRPSAPPAPKSASQAITGWIAKLEYHRQTSAYPIIYLRINGSEPLPFYLKLNSPVGIVVDEPAARALKLSDVNLSGDDANGQEASLRTIAVQSVLLDVPQGALNLGVRSVLVTNAHLEGEAQTEQKVYGIVGSGVWRGATLGIDLARQTFTVIAVNHAPFDTLPNATVLPLRQDPFTQDVYVEWSAKYDKSVLPLKISLARNTLLAPVTADSLNPARRASVPGGEGLPGTQSLALIPDFPLGSYRLHTVSVVSDARQSPALGADVLARCVVWLDFRHQQMVLVPGSAQEPLSLPGSTGLILTRKNGGIYISAVLPFAAQALSDLIGQEVLQIQGKPARTMRLKLAQSLLGGDAGGSVTLMLRKGAKETTRTVSQTDVYSAFARP